MASTADEGAGTGPVADALRRRQAALKERGYIAEARPQRQGDYAQAAWLAFVSGPQGRVHVGTSLHDSEGEALREALAVGEDHSAG